MRLYRFLLAAAASGLITITAAAQDAAPPPVADPEPGLSDLSETVRQLEDEPPAETVETPPTESATPPPTESAAPPPAEATTPPPATPPGPPPPLTRAQRTELDRLVARGRLLTAIARGGALATRDMLTRISDPEGAGIAGWIAEPAGNAITVTFYANAANGPVAVYRGAVLGGRVTERQIHLGADRPALNPIQARMAAARAATDGLEHSACSDQPFDVLVVPPETVADPVDVYQMTRPTQQGRFPFGGHFKTSVAPDGSVATSRAFSSNCLDVAAPATAAGQQPAPIAVTHLLDPMPSEIHVFLSAWTGRPLLVATGEPQRLWAVTVDGIAEVRQ